jgi:Fe-S-cluster-containing dehydrogenase component/CRP-like cAMP-binding protein
LIVPSAPVELVRPNRWDEPFGEFPLTDREIDWILTRSPFNQIDASLFPESTPLRELLRNDTRVMRYIPGDVVVREGDYGTSVYYVLSGSVRVVTGDGESFASEIQGSAHHHKKSVWSALSQLWSNSRFAEARDYAASSADARGQNEGLFLTDVAAVLEKYTTASIGESEFFGEAAALGRTPRGNHMFAESQTELLEIRWQGLRDIMRRAPHLQNVIETAYKDNALANQLKETPIFEHLSKEDHRAIADATTFASYGRRDWTAAFHRAAQKTTSEQLSNEPIIAEEGHYPNHLILIRSGFARVSHEFGNGHRTIRYLGRGETFGFEELYENWRSSEPVPFRNTLRAVGYVDVLQIPTNVVERLVLPTLPSGLLPEAIEAEPKEQSEAISSGIRTDHIEQLVESRTINGSATMVIDLERCTGCDDCVRACSSTHDGNPRFIRHGLKIGKFMIANACMHCIDPVCMIGCPTGAIHRVSLEGQVAINDRTCIGCETCANNCPYHNIRMVEIRDSRGAPLLDRETLSPIIKATKCDLCVDQRIGPACQNACPHDALKRVDMVEIGPLQELLER